MHMQDASNDMILRVRFRLPVRWIKIILKDYQVKQYPLSGVLRTIRSRVDILLC